VEEVFLDGSCDPYGEAKGFCREVEVMWSSRAAESELPGKRGVAAALVCVVAGREKLMGVKSVMTGKGRGSAACCQIAQAAVKRMECGTLREGELMPKDYGFEK
jgi:hypothetical protein